MIPTRAAGFAAVLLTSSAFLGAAAGTASASPGRGAKPSLEGALSNGVHYAKLTSVKFEASYDAENYYGPVRCLGVHQTNEKRGYPGTETTGGRDVERCTSTTGKPLVNMTPGEEGHGSFPGPANIWESDYFLFIKGLSRRTYDMTYKVSANGKSFKLVAYYNEEG